MKSIMVHVFIVLIFMPIFVQSEKVDSWLTGNEILKKLSDNDARNRKLLAVKDDQIKEIYQMLFAKDDQNREIY